MLRRIEDRATAGMNGPEINRGKLTAMGNARARAGETLAQLARNLAREMHVEALLTDTPCDELIGTREVDGEKAIESETRGLGCNEIGGAPIGEDGEGKQLLQIVGLLHMQGTEFEREEQDFGVGLGANDVARGLEGVDGCIATHEADEGALDGGIESGELDDLKVDAGRIEPGAGGHDHVRDSLAFCVGERELQERAAGELRCELPKGLHAAGSRREVAAHKQRVFVLHYALISDDWFEERVAVLDGGKAHHAAIEIARRALGQEAFSKGNECAVHIVRRNRSGDAIEMGSRHCVTSGAPGVESLWKAYRAECR